MMCDLMQYWTLLSAAFLAYLLICAFVGANIAGAKNHNRANFFFWSLLMLGALGVAVAVLVPPAEPEPAA
jgi:CHASE2 domain-containing sensor protein